MPVQTLLQDADSAARNRREALRIWNANCTRVLLADTAVSQRRYFTQARKFDFGDMELVLSTFFWLQLRERWWAGRTLQVSRAVLPSNAPSASPALRLAILPVR
jgi:hypothetical protein